jgi:DUF971 family protein
VSTDPQSVRINKSTGTGVEIDWKDGHKSSYKFQYLRDCCPCATCDDEREKSGAEFGQPPAQKAGALPMYRDPARPAEVERVGNYAVSFVWNDGHRAGIYSWEFLRAICPCADCAAARAANPEAKLKPGGSGAIS